MYPSNSSNTDLTSPLIHSVTRTLPGAFEGRWLVCVCHTCRQKLCGVSSEPLKSYSGRGPCWPSAAGGRVLSLFNTCAFLGSSSAVTVVTVGVTAGGGWVTAEGVGLGVGGSIFTFNVQTMFLEKGQSSCIFPHCQSTVRARKPVKTPSKRAK